MKKINIWLATLLVILVSCDNNDNIESKTLHLDDPNSDRLSKFRNHKNIAPKTFYLESSNLDQTIKFQHLVDQMNEFDKLILRAGPHYISGTVMINKPNLTIIGENLSTIRKSGHFSCIDINESANKTTIDNVDIDGGGFINGDVNKPRKEPCMRIFSNENYIVNSKFHNSGDNSGLLLHGSHLNLIEGCKFYYNYMVGLSQWYSSDNEIKYCQMYENGAEGITIDGFSHNSTIHHCWIHKNNLPKRGVGGIGIDASNGAQIFNNTIDFNGLDGIKFQNNLCGGCDGVTIYNNLNISNNERAAIGKRFNNQQISNLGIYNNVTHGNPLGAEFTYNSSFAGEENKVCKQFNIYGIN